MVKEAAETEEENGMEKLDWEEQQDAWYGYVLNYVGTISRTSPVSLSPLLCSRFLDLLMTQSI